MSTIKSSDEHLTINADGSGKDIKLQNNGSENVIVKSDGSVGVGTSSPNHKLSVSGAGSQGTLGLYSSGTSNELRLEHDGGSHWVVNGVSDGIRFKASNSEKIRIDGDGLKFNGDTSSSNALDDYEEGTWTAVLEGVTTITNTVGYYTKIGRQVNFNFYSSAFTSTGGTAKISGLPYAPTAASQAYTAFTSAHNNWTPNASGGYVHKTSPYMLLVDAGATTAATSVSGSTNKYIMVQGTYFTNA